MYVFELFQQEKKITMIQLITDLIILQININRIKNKLEELKLLIHNTHAYIITIQEIKLTPKANTPKVHNFTTVRADRWHKAGGGLITLIRNNITLLQQTYLRPSIHTTQKFKWSRYTLTTLNISQLQTFIYLLQTEHKERKYLDPAVQLLHEEITSDIQKHKQTYGWNTLMHTGITGTTLTFFGRPYTVYPTEHLHPH